MMSAEERSLGKLWDGTYAEAAGAGRESTGQAASSRAKTPTALHLLPLCICWIHALESCQKAYLFYTVVQQCHA
jgi:hypothetical protein